MNYVELVLRLPIQWRFSRPTEREVLALFLALSLEEWVTPNYTRSETNTEASMKLFASLHLPRLSAASAQGEL